MIQAMCLKLSHPGSADAPLSSLSSQERSLLYLTARGDSPAQAAQTLGMTPAEAQALLAALQARFGLPTRNALIVHAVVQGWV